MLKGKLTVLKIGGKICEDESGLKNLLNLFVKIEGKKILIHGGGKSASRLSEQLGISVNMIDGRRVTDNESLKVAVMIYAGWVNKNIVAKLQSQNCKSIGLSGADLGIIESQKRKATPVDYGYVGDVKNVDSRQIGSLIEENIVPVFSAITMDSTGQLLNTNADTMASEIALAMSKLYDVSLLYCFEKQGVMMGDRLINNLNESEFMRGIDEGFITEGMIPKLQNGFEAINDGVKDVFISSALELDGILNSKEGGTRLCKG